MNGYVFARIQKKKQKTKPKSKKKNKKQNKNQKKKSIQVFFHEDSQFT